MYREWLSEICRAQHITCETLSLGWVYKLTKDGRARHLIGHHIDANGAAADRIACDKYACYCLLEAAGIPAVPHEIIFDPVTRPGWMGAAGAWRQAQAFFDACGQDVVIKPNEGWQGHDVSRCRTFAEAEQALSALFRRGMNACLCPFYDIPYEYRVYYAYGDCPLVYGKARAPGLWKHNLSGGARAFDVTDADLAARLQALARQAAACIGMAFATVDIAQTAEGALLVMEVNAGVSARRLLEQLPHHADTLKEMYARVIRHMWEEQL